MARDGLSDISVPTDVRDQAREAKRDDETWGDYLLRCAEAEADVTELADLEDVKAAVEEAIEG